MSGPVTEGEERGDGAGGILLPSECGEGFDLATIGAAGVLGAEGGEPEAERGAGVALDVRNDERMAVGDGRDVVHS